MTILHLGWSPLETFGCSRCTYKKDPLLFSSSCLSSVSAATPRHHVGHVLLETLCSKGQISPRQQGTFPAGTVRPEQSGWNPDFRWCFPPQNLTAPCQCTQGVELRMGMSWWHELNNNLLLSRSSPLSHPVTHAMQTTEKQWQISGDLVQF